MNTQLHPVFPAGIETGNIEPWLEQYNIDKHNHQNHIVFTEDELNDMAREASAAGAETEDLTDIVAEVKKVIRVSPYKAKR